MKYFLACLLFFLCLISFGQQTIKSDSLRQIATITSNDTLKVKAWSDLYDLFRNDIENYDSALYYSKKIIRYSSKENYTTGKYIGYNRIANYFFTHNQYDSAYFYSKKSYEIAKKLNNKKYLGKSENLLAYISFRMQKKDSVAAYLSKAIKNGLDTGDVEILCNAYLLKGNLHYRKFENEKALQYYYKIDSLTKNKKAYNAALCKSLINTGNLLLRSYSVSDTSYIKKGENYFLRARDVAKQINNKDEENYAISQLGKIYIQRKNYKKAIDYFEKSVTYFEKAHAIREMSNIYWSLGISYNQLKKLKKADEYYKKRIKLYEQLNSKAGLAEAYWTYAGFNYYNKNFDEAIPNYLIALRLFDSIKSNRIGPITAANYELANSYAKKKNYKDAYNFLYKAFQLQDSLNDNKQDKITLELEKKYQAKKKEHEIALLTSQNKLAKQEKEQQRNLLVGGIGITSLAGLFFFFMYRNRQKTAKKLQELDKAKSKFFANISHEFRTPLTLLSAPLEKRLEDKKLKKEDRSDFEMMQRNSQRLLSLIDQLLDLSKLESGNLKLKVSRGNLSQLLKSIASSFQYLASQKNIHYTIDITPLKNVWFDRGLVEKMVINLLSNAFKYTKDKGNITFKSTVKNKQLELLIENSGTILTNQQIAKIFNRFYQSNEQNEGVGIGLSLVKELVELSHGTIAVENTSRQTILFTVLLPIDKTAFTKGEFVTPKDKKDTIISKKLATQILENKIPENKPIDKDQPILLIVEDNSDVRNFIKRSFSKKYQIITAKNGKSGIKKAITFIPDIIISDIMMPKVTGLELCKHLKQDERTSHVPIILLTAKVEKEDQYKGLTIGADAYITKPFTLKLLETQVDNLVAIRTSLRNRYSQEIILKPKDIAITNLDEQFLKRIQDVLDNKLIESSFTIEEFSKAVGLSRMQLHRKLKALTGLSTSEFIRSQRLKLAAQLLKKSEINVSQVGYSVGFNDHSYFSKCFKEIYHCTPTEYAHKRK